MRGRSGPIEELQFVSPPDGFGECERRAADSAGAVEVVFALGTVGEDVRGVEQVHGLVSPSCCVMNGQS